MLRARVRQAVLEGAAAVRRRRARRVTRCSRRTTRCSPRCTSRRTTSTRVVLLGQDPYHGPRQAHGLCFSVQRRRAVAAVARQHLHGAARRPRHRDAQRTATSRRGRARACCCSTPASPCAPGAAASHQGKGWETFTDEVLRTVNAKPHRVVFILWGAHARKKKALIDTQPPHRDRVRAPLAAQRPQRLLRQQAVQPRQRRADRGRPDPSTGASRSTWRLPERSPVWRDRGYTPPVERAISRRGWGSCRGLRRVAGRCRSRRRRSGRTSCRSVGH